MKNFLSEAIHRSTIARIVVGFSVVYFVLTFIVFGYNQITETISEAAAARTLAAPATDYFYYSEVRTKKGTYAVGEALTFQSTRSYRGNYPINYIDRIICPDNPRALIETASTSSFTVDTGGKQQQVDWTFGDYNQGKSFSAKPITSPQENCISEHLITVEVAPSVYKSQLFINNNKFDVVGEQ